MIANTLSPSWQTTGRIRQVTVVTDDGTTGEILNQLVRSKIKNSELIMSEFLPKRVIDLNCTRWFRQQSIPPVKDSQIRHSISIPSLSSAIWIATLRLSRIIGTLLPGYNIYHSVPSGEGRKERLAGPYTPSSGLC